MKQCTSYKQYKKILRKYAKRNWRKYRGWWVIWVDYQVFDRPTIEEILSQSTKKGGNLPLILKDLLEGLGKQCYFRGPNEVGTLIGLDMTNEDYYWIYLNKDGKKSYETCVGGWKLVE